MIASVGVSRDGALLNVNADTMAAHLAALLGADRLIIAGATAGVLDDEGQLIPGAVARRHRRMIASGDAHSGMVAKLTACRAALDRRRARSRDRRGPRRRRTTRTATGTRDSSGDGDDMTTATDVIAVETDHLLQVYRRGRVVFERGRGCRLFDARRPRAIST